ncbi:methyltransferase domain protein [Ceratobasidium sp. AG-Ba]|nr:methyltransferase domain protein [Ceratobasidium sp. AG-Ba]QRV91061.1 methyltransferase domain protein [Ceratobasidium sp. AG-Ba]QRW05150.1 methyltransferase domain protein [Ceratobasidium sp. AG-Ba]
MDVDEHDSPVYLVDDFQEEDSDMDSVHTHTTGFTEHTMSTLTSDAALEYFQEVNGRMFPLDENLPFLFPADNAEVHRLEIQHEAVKILLKGNYYGPVREVLGDLDPDGRRKRVLDLITGEGSWVREMAAEFPHVDFTSVDNTPLVPHSRCTNILGYEVYDLYNGIAEEDNTFDVVHVRHAMTKIRDLPGLILEIHRVLKPGGLLLYGEFQNNGWDASTEDHSAEETTPCLIHALRIARDIFSKQGAYAFAWRDVPPLLQPESVIWDSVKGLDKHQRGFTSIRLESKVAPTGTWHSNPRLRESGWLMQQLWVRTWMSLRPMFIKGGLCESETDELVGGAIRELIIPSSRKLYGKYTVLYAFKPM